MEVSHDPWLLVVCVHALNMVVPALTSPFSLKNHGVDSEADQMFEMGAETMKLPLEEKMKFEQGDSGLSFG